MVPVFVDNGDGIITIEKNNIQLEIWKVERDVRRHEIGRSSV